MKTHTNNFKEEISKFGRQIDSRITFGSTVLGKNDLNAVTPSYQGAILKSVMKQLDIDSNVAIPIGTNLKYEFGLKVNGKYEYINYGNYVVYSIEKQEDTNSYKIVCYDKLLYSMLDYVKLPITYPISIRDYINAISTTLGLKFANKSGTFANYNKQIQADLYDGLGYTFRDILDELAQVTASTICLNNNDELEIRYITETDDTIDEEFLKDVNVNFGEKFGKVNTIVLSRSAGSDNIYYPTVLPTNPYEIKISDNQIMNGNDRADFLPDIYNKLNGLEFYTNDFVSTGICYYDLCDRYSVKVGDTTYSCVMFNDEVLVTQGLEENIYTELPEQTETDYKKADTTDRRINQAYAILDKQNKKFEVLVSEVNSNEEKIGSLEITTGNISTKVSSVEKNLSTTNSNLSNLSGKVDTLSDDINGVSADFEDFKDNEYIQSIDNLQKQIDGAIQFWNGAEIPTINNYPANQWTTENDRINHQADIYTVIQDVQGEMKQGKSYRFDKVGGVWQWIELTDNELSAVQAIAQEALDKAKANATEIGTVKTRVSSLEQTDEQIKASVESIDKQIIPTATATGSSIYIEDASDSPLIELEIEGKSEQEIRNGKNKFRLKDISSVYGTYTYLTDNSFKLSSNNTNRSYIDVEIENLKPNTTYNLSFDVSNTNPNATTGIDAYYDNNGSWTYFTAASGYYTNKSFTIPNSNKIQLRIYGSYAIVENVSTIKDIQLEEGTTKTSFEPYGVSPSPDYPSEIKSVGYENLLGLIDGTYTNDGITAIVKNGVVTVNGTYTGSSNGWLNISTKQYSLISGNTYTLSLNNLEALTGGSQLRTLSSGALDCSFATSNRTNTQTLTSDASNSRIQIRLVAGITFNNFVFKPQIEIGSIAHSYIPYGKYGIEVETVGKQLFNKNNITSGKILVRSTGSTSTNANYGVSDYIPVKKGITYYQQGTNIYYSVYYDKYYNYVTYIDNTSRAFTPSQDGYIRTSFLLTDIDKVQVEKGDIPTEVEEYQSNTSLIVLDQPLRSLPNGVKDLAYIKNNKLYVYRYVGSVVLNGSESWYDFNLHNGTKYFTTNLTKYDIKMVVEPQVRCIANHLQGATITQTWNGSVLNSISLSTNGYYMQVCMAQEIGTTIDEFKTWLLTHNTQIDYELAEPYTEEYGEIKMPSTFKGVNHISTTDSLEPTINIEYVRDTTLSNYVEGQINKVMTIEKRHYSELVIEDNSIKESVESVNSSLNGLNTTINRVEEITTDNSQVINVISTNIDRTSGEVREVTTTTGFTFNADGMTIDDGSGFKAEHTANGTYYKDGNSIVGQYTKDGSKQKDLELFGIYSYGKESIEDTPMFVGQLYTDANGEQAFGHFYNGEG